MNDSASSPNTTNSTNLTKAVTNMKVLPAGAQVSNANDHSAYANNAEDYWKKGPSGGTKTPADKVSKKLKRATGAAMNNKYSNQGGKQTVPGLKTSVVSNASTNGTNSVIGTANKDF